MKYIIVILLLTSCAVSDDVYIMDIDFQQISNNKKTQSTETVVFSDLKSGKPFYVSYNGQLRKYMPRSHGYYYFHNKYYLIKKHIDDCGFIIWINSVDGLDCLIISLDKNGKRRDNP